MKPLKLITILSVAILIFLPSLALAKGKPPKPPVDNAVVYTVELTGVFNFPAHDVTLTKGRLNSVDTGDLVIEGDGTAWDAVFTSCAGFTPTISYMKVNFDDWGVGRNGDDGILWISFANIRLPEGDVPEKEIQIQLQRRFDSNPTFLPTDSDPEISFLLDYYVVWGKPLSGKGKNRSWDTCYQSGDGNNTVDFLPANAKLVIAIKP